MRDFLWQIVLLIIGLVASIGGPLLTKRIQKWFVILLGVLFVCISSFWAGIEYDKQSGYTSFEAMPVLISISYKIGDFNPRLLDLRTALSDGIPVGEDQSLQLFDLWVSVPQDVPEYEIEAQIYVNDELIGSTPRKPIDKKQTFSLGEIVIKAFNHDVVPKAWRVQSDWKNLVVVLVTYDQDEEINKAYTTINLDPSSTAWLVKAPLVNFISIVYTVNDGPERVLDLRDANKDLAGLLIQPTDKLTLLEIWYQANASSRAEVLKFEAYLTSEKFDSSTYQVSSKNFINRGVNKLSNYTPVSWIIPNNKNLMILSLTRSDNSTLIDRLMIPLSSSGNPGLIRSNDP